MGSKRLKFEETEDRISDLPDSIIHDILSFLPSAKQVIQTCILSKRWKNQWSHVPVLIFDSTCMSLRNFLKFIEKSQLQYGHYGNQTGPRYTAEVRFAMRRDVEELNVSSDKRFLLPDFLFNNASLVKLRTDNCTFTPRVKVNWGCLTALNMENFNVRAQTMQHILSGSPLLESLELTDSFFEFDKLVIASESLKRLVLRELTSIFDVEISCPKLEKLKLFDCLNVKTATLLNLPASLCATIDVYHHEEVWSNSAKEIRSSLIKEILRQLQHVNELKLGSWFIKILSSLEHSEGLSLPALNIKYLILNSPDLNERHYGIAYVLRNSRVLEKLVVNVSFDDQYYWSSHEAFFDCLVSHLKIIKINGFSKRDDKRKLVLDFAEFLFKNAKMLKKMEVVLKVHGTIFPVKVSQLC